MNYNLAWYSVKGCMSPHCNKALWDIALKYFKETGDADGWYVLLHGA